MVSDIEGNRMARLDRWNIKCSDCGKSFSSPKAYIDHKRVTLTCTKR